MPSLAAAASWLESSKLPMREMRQRYTKSELAISAWRSHEIAYNMSQNMQNIRSTQNQDRTQYVSNAVIDKQLEDIEQRMGAVASKITDERGEIDLRKLSAAEVAQFLGAFGIPLVVPS